VHTEYCLENQEERGAGRSTGYNQAEWKYFQIRFNSRLQTTSEHQSDSYISSQQREISTIFKQKQFPCTALTD